MKRKQNFWIISSANKKSPPIAKKIEKVLFKKGFIKDESNPDYLFIIGGDGSFVKGIKNYFGFETRVIAINSGTLGFYSNFSFENLTKFEKKITERKNYIQPWVVEAKVNGQKFHGINEIVISSLSTMSSKVMINDIFYQKYKGSGIAFSTKTGTTGYCKNLGGAIIMPDIEAYEMVEIAPTVHSKNISLRSPVILNHSAYINLSDVSSTQPIWLICDGSNQTEIKEGSKVEISLIKAKCKLFFPGTNAEYIKKIHKAFIKGK